MVMNLLSLIFKLLKLFTCRAFNLNGFTCINLRLVTPYICIFEKIIVLSIQVITETVFKMVCERYI